MTGRRLETRNAFLLQPVVRPIGGWYQLYVARGMEASPKTGCPSSAQGRTHRPYSATLCWLNCRARPMHPWTLCRDAQSCSPRQAVCSVTSLLSAAEPHTTWGIIISLPFSTKLLHDTSAQWLATRRRHSAAQRCWRVPRAGLTHTRARRTADPAAGVGNLDDPQLKRRRLDDLPFPTIAQNNNVGGPRLELRIGPHFLASLFWGRVISRPTEPYSLFGAK